MNTRNPHLITLERLIASPLGAVLRAAIVLSCGALAAWAARFV